MRESRDRGEERGERREVDRLDVSVDDLWCITVTSSPAPQLSSQQRMGELQTLHCYPGTVQATAQSNLIIIHYLLIRDFTHLVCLIYGSTASTLL